MGEVSGERCVQLSPTWVRMAFWLDTTWLWMPKHLHLPAWVGGGGLWMGLLGHTLGILGLRV